MVCDIDYITIGSLRENGICDGAQLIAILEVRNQHSVLGLGSGLGLLGVIRYARIGMSWK